MFHQEKTFEIMHIELYHVLVQIHGNVFTVRFVYKCWDFQLHMASTILILLTKCNLIQQTKQINIKQVNETTHLDKTIVTDALLP